LATIIAGFGFPHTPQLSSSPDHWRDHALRDQQNRTLLGLDGEIHTYDELLQQVGKRFENANTEEAWWQAYERAQRDVGAIAEEYSNVSERADIVVVIGGDLHELFLNLGTPALALYLGDTLLDFPLPAEELERTPSGIKAAMWARHSEEIRAYPADPSLSQFLLEELSHDNFDVMQFSVQPTGRPLGHSFSFVPLRLGGRSSIRMVPLFINTYFPPNQPSPSRCLDLGRSLRKAIEAWPESAKVIIIASGGLSHFVINEDLDLRLLTALRDHDLESLGRISLDELRGGSGEILSWIVAGAALENLSMEIVDYVPSYRSAAGTGVGMGFAHWV